MFESSQIDGTAWVVSTTSLSPVHLTKQMLKSVEKSAGHHLKATAWGRFLVWSNNSCLDDRPFGGGEGTI